jgi:putative membrane protein
MCVKSIIIKKTSFMKKLVGVLYIGCLCTFMACNGGSSNSNSVDSAKNINDSMMPDSSSMKKSDTAATTMSSAPVSKEDADWAVDVANAGMTEIELSKVAQTKANSDRLKNFANMMVTDHTTASDKLKQIAASKNITLPANLSDASQKKLDELNKKTGKDFDKAYINDMLDGHKKAVDAFQKGSTKLQDAYLKNFAAQTLPTIQMHQDSIKAIAGKK